MKNPKSKGTRWENEASKLLNEDFPDTWRRVAMSGALGTMLDIPMFSADLIGDYSFMPFKIVAEAKSGYGKKQMTIKPDWFDHIEEIGDKTFSLPVVLLRFDNLRDTNNRYIIAMNFDSWNKIMKLLEDYERLEEADNGENG